MKKLLLLLACSPLAMQAQDTDAGQISKIYTEALTHAKCYGWLEHLCHKIGPRLSGSANAEKAVAYTQAEMQALGLDRVFLQEVMVPHWVRGEKEKAWFISKGKKTTVPVCALGGSVATPVGGIKAQVVEVHGLKELETLGTAQLSGKIVFFNRPMDAALIDPMQAYGGAVDQRGAGAREAAKYGAVGVIVRSMNVRSDDFPHTGFMGYGKNPDARFIPAAAISTNGADLLSQSLKSDPKLEFWFQQSCRKFDDVLSHNVVGEIKGSEFPDQIIVVGGHLDSWDLAEGAQDDGAGIVQSMEVLHLFKQLGYKPKHTLRAVMFMNEENGARGGDKYNDYAQQAQERHIFALESDSGGFTPRGFTIEAADNQIEAIQQWKKLFEPYMLHIFAKGHSGTDIEPLQSTGIVKAGLKPDTQRYFDYHHAATDTFEAVNKRELELGAAAMAALIYLVDQYGIK